MLVPLYQEAVAVPYNHPLQMCRHDISSFQCSRWRWKELELLLLKWI